MISPFVPFVDGSVPKAADFNQLAKSAFDNATQTALDKFATNGDRTQTGSDRSAASGSASAASGSASAASGSASSASGSAGTASTSADAALATQTAINNRYRGALAADPATRTDGTPNQVGDEYFYIGGLPNLLKRWNGTAPWQASDINTANLAASGGAGLVSTIQAGTNAVSRTVQDKVRDSVSAMDFSGTTGTEKVQAAINSLAATGGFVLVNRGIVYDYNALTNMTSPKMIGLIDEASQQMILSHTKITGAVSSPGHIVFKDARSNSAGRIHIEPNGFPVGTSSKLDVMLDDYEADGVNYRIVNLYTKNYDPADLATQQGSNGVAVLGVKATGGHFGVWPDLHIGFSDDGPLAAVPLKVIYFDTSDSAWRPVRGAWRTGIAGVTVGEYYLANNKLYQSTTAGTTGATKPAHTAGTVSDGSVSWAFVRDYAAASGAIKGCVLVGDRDDRPKFGFPNLRAQFAKAVGFWNNIGVQFMNGANTAIAWTMKTRNLVDDLYIENVDSTKFLRFGSNFIQDQGLAELLSTKTVADNSVTPDVTGTRIVILSNTSATSITAFAGSPRQRLIVQAGNGNTTLVNSASLRLNTGANKVLTVNSCLEFISNGAGTAWTEVGML